MLSRMLCSGESRRPMVPAAIKQLKEDFKGDNADARDEDLRRDDYERRIDGATKSLASDKKNREKMLWLAESYAVLEPDDPRAHEQCEKLLQNFGISDMDAQRQGDFWQLYGRCLFMNDQTNEALLAFLKARTLYQTKGSKPLRKNNNVSLLRTYAALGKSQLAAERLEVALTLVDNLDHTILLYMHAKHTLENTGDARDVEVLDDIWYVELDINKELKDKFEQYNNMTSGVMKGCKPETPAGEEEWSEIWKRVKRAVKDMGKDTTIMYLVMGMVGLLIAMLLCLISINSKKR